MMAIKSEKNTLNCLKSLLQVLLLLLLLVAGSRAEAADRANAYLQAKEAFYQKDFAAGVKRYYRFITFSEIVLSQQIRATDLEQARDFFEHEAQNPANAEKALLFLALIDRITDNWEKAHERADFLRQKHPRSLLLNYIKGEMHLAQNQIKEAKQHLDWILSAADGSPFAEITRKLLEFYLNSGAANPEKRKKFLLAAGYRNWDILETDQAVRFFEMVIEGYPDDPEAWRSLISIYLDRDDLDNVLELDGRWLQNNKTSLLDPMTRVRLHLKNDEFNEAAEIIEKLLEADSGNQAAKMLLADCLFNLNKLEPCLSLYQELLPDNHGNMGIISRLKHCFESLGRLDEAINLFEQLAQEDAENSWIQLELAELYLKVENYDQAEVYFDLLSGFENPYKDYATDMSPRIPVYKQELAQQELERLEQSAQTTPVADPPANSAPSVTETTSEKIKEVQLDELKKLMAIYE